VTLYLARCFCLNPGGVIHWQREGWWIDSVRNAARCEMNGCKKGKAGSPEKRRRPYVTAPPPSGESSTREVETRRNLAFRSVRKKEKSKTISVAYEGQWVHRWLLLSGFWAGGEAVTGTKIGIDCRFFYLFSWHWLSACCAGVCLAGLLVRVSLALPHRADDAAFGVLRLRRALCSIAGQFGAWSELSVGDVP